ncbi:MAG: FG-GAP-like repeat-containing protein, partial [Pseudomonadota bacterium]|nr:FG-GAP-like repeat-containing protein [Pseudomonadota bacterium]
GDGDLDIVSASMNDDTIAWYENDGSANPSWTAADIATSADFATHVYVADMDGDGDLDIVSASHYDDTIAWYENNGAADPTWAAADIATSADGAHDVHVADMDGDGDLDIISASVHDDTIAWYENDGAANPSWAAADIATSADGAFGVHVADMDGDGDLDIVSASVNDDTIAWYESNAADVNLTTDAKAGVDYTASSGTLTFAAGETSKTFTVPVLADMDAENNETATLTLSGASNASISDATGTLTITDDDSIVFTAADIATSADGAWDVYVADLDGDGDLDIVAASMNDNTSAWYENDGAANPSWTAADIATSARSALAVFVGDMDGDGDLDIVSASRHDHTIAWYENDGSANP